MKIKSLLLGLLAVVAVVGCNNNGDGGESKDSKFSIDRDVVDISAEGGFVSVGYVLKGGNSAVKPIAKCDEAWIVDFDNSQQGSISFRVMMNESEQMREAVVTFKALGVEEMPQLRVKQMGLGSAMLTVEVVDTDYSECKVSLTPASDTLPYVVTMAERDYFEKSGISTADELVEADLARYYTYMSGDESVEEFLGRANLLNYGEQNKVWADLSPAKEYVIYAYGVYVAGDTYERSTPIYYVTIDKRMEERLLQNFGVSITTNGPEVEFNIVPESWEGYYMVQLVEDSEAGYIEQGLPLGEAFEEAVGEAFFYVADHLYYFEQKSAEEIMQQLGYKGAVSFSKTLNADHRYMAIIYAIDSVEGNVPMMVSTATVEYFTTGTVERSDMTFDVTFENIRPRSVDVTIIPSTDECYTAVMMYASNMPDGDKQEQLDYVMSKYAPLELSGVYSEHITQLPPETEFIIAVCGYYAGSPTTDLFLYRFTTLEDGVGDNIVVEATFTAFDIDDVVAIEPYYAAYANYADYFLSMELTTLEPSPSLHFELYAKHQYDEYSHEEIRESMLEYAYTSSPDWALCTYGNEYVLCALAEDENGYVGEMYVSEPIRFTSDQTSDAAVFVELYKEYVTPKALIFGK